MPTVTSDLARVQARLHDGGALWPRAELLRWYGDGYRELLALSKAVRRYRLMDLPGRHSYGLTYEWEDRHTTGTVRKPFRTMLAGARQGTTLWESESLAGVTPAAALAGYTQDWERAFIGDTDRHYRFSFPKNHERVYRLMWSERVLLPVSVRELDEDDDAWQARIGEPRWWTTGTGRIPSVELYEIVDSYNQQYALEQYEAGTPRQFTGRTYAIAIGTASNAYAYTTSGDADALTVTDTPFVPASAYCHSWESTALRHLPGYNFTINLTMAPNITRVAVHPWEIGEHGLAADSATPGRRGMFPWERLDPAKSYESQTFLPSTRPAITQPGARITTAAATPANGFGTQVWEAEHLDGKTTFTTGKAQACFPWESQHGAASLTLGLGVIRSLTSPDRQYLGVASDPGPMPMLGTIRDWRSSADSLAVVEVIVPDAPLLEASVPALLPGPLQKYLRYYVLARTFGRAGEGHSTILADHYQRRFLRGVALFMRLADVAHRDRVFQREMVTPPSRRIARVSLPSEFPAVF